MAKIIALDDDKLILDMIELVFTEAGHEVVTFQNPLDVPTYLVKNPADAMVLDVMMPEIDGWDLLQIIRTNQTNQDIPIIMLTSLNETFHRIRGLRMGANDYLGKPFDPQELLARTETLINWRADGSLGFSGGLGENTTAEIVQSLKLNKKTGTLKLENKGTLGHLRFYKGSLIRAACNHLTQLQAVEALFELSEGTYRFELMNEAAFTEPVNELAVEKAMSRHLRNQEDLKKRQSWLPLPNQRLRVKTPLPEIPEDLQIHPIEKVYQVIQKKPSVTLVWLQKAFRGAPIYVKLALSWLIQNGAVRIVENKGED